MPKDTMTSRERWLAVLRRVRPADPKKRPRSAMLAIGDVEIDFRRHEARRKGKKITLSDRAFLVLEVLARYRGEVVSREQLLEEAWGYERNLNTRTVDNHVVKIRQDIEEDSDQPQLVLTVWGVGYKLTEEGP